MPYKEASVILHKGIFKKKATVSEAVFMITGMTIGAGVLGIPYTAAQVGLWVGLLYIALLGIAILSLNLMIGEIAVRSKEQLQLPGLAGKYLGPWAKHFLSTTIILSSTGALLAYVVGEGEALSALFGGNPLWWSIFFWSVGSFAIWRGLQTVKKAEKVMSFLVIGIIVGLSLYLMPYVDKANLYYMNLANIFLPYGVILFALHASPAIAEAHALLPDSQKNFKKAIIIGTLIPIVVYMLFALAVVGASGLSVTEVATVGLGAQFGPGILLVANIFAVLAMGTAFMGLGMALKQVLVWDHKMSKWLADFLVMMAPLSLFLIGIRSFVLILGFVGGLFIGIEAVIMVLVCYQARRRGDIAIRGYKSIPFWVLAGPVLVLFTLASVYSIVKIIIN